MLVSEDWCSCCRGERISALAAEKYPEMRAARGSRRKFKRALGEVKDVEPEERDRRR
ncbi:MAG: hypothetical protein L0228_00380 [Planctomycetes bacterium]|nr:hypothetical protein [Planctomycetota bacterium]